MPARRREFICTRGDRHQRDRIKIGIRLMTILTDIIPSVGLAQRTTTAMPYSMSQPELEPICLIFSLPELRSQGCHK